MMKRKCSLKVFMIAVFLVCAAIVSAGILQADSLQNGRIPFMTKPAFEDGWTYDNGSRQGAVLSFPYEGEEKSDHLTLSTKLPDLDGNEYLSFANQYCSTQVFVDGKKIYDYGSEVSAPFGRMLGNAACNVPMKSEYSGKTISIRLEKQYSFYHYNVQEMLLGTGGEIRLYYSKTNAGVLGCSLMMGLLSLFMLVMYLVQKSKGFKDNYKLFLDLGVFSFLAAMWIWTDSLLPQLILGNTIFVTVLSFWSFMAMPIPVIGIVNDFCSHGKKGLYIAEKALLLNMIIQTFLYILNIADYPQMLLVTHCILAFTLVCMIYALLRESRSENAKLSNDILFALFVLILFGIAALISFYLHGSANSNSLYYRWGTLIFVALLTMVNIKKMGMFLEEWEENRVLSRMAFIDVMTQTKNRSAYERYLDERIHSDARETNVCLALMDLNDLKKINDAYGHNAGDKILIDAAECIKKAFGGHSNAYRIGGDEFVVILEGKKRDGRVYREKLNREVEKCSRKGEYPFTLAFGFASAIEEDCGNLKELQEKADLNMYMDKREYK